MMFVITPGQGSLTYPDVLVPGSLSITVISSLSGQGVFRRCTEAVTRQIVWDRLLSMAS